MTSHSVPSFAGGDNSHAPCLQSSLVKLESELGAKFPDVSPIFKREKVDKYFSMTLALTHFTETNIQSLLRIPMVDRDAVFQINQQEINQGLITLESARYKVILTINQHKRCFRTTEQNNNDRYCLLRPCLIKSDSDMNFKCISVNETSFLLSISSR